jgi:hypothetical protein
MKLVEITNINKKDIPLHYRREFTGSAVFNDTNDRQVKSDIQFIIEYQHSGNFDVKVNLLDSINYPLIPTIHMLRDHIIALEKRGAL